MVDGAMSSCFSCRVSTNFCQLSNYQSLKRTIFDGFVKHYLSCIEDDCSDKKNYQQFL